MKVSLRLTRPSGLPCSRALIALLSLAVFLAACGGSSATSADTSPTSAPAASAPTSAPAAPAAPAATAAPAVTAALEATAAPAATAAPEATTSTATSPTSNAASTSAPCDKATGFTLYSAQGYDAEVAKAFQQQTGITANLVDDSTGNLLAKISAEGSNPQWDVTWFDGNVTMQTLDDQNLLLKWQSPNAANITDQAKPNIASDGSYYPTGLTTVGAIAYNKSHIPAAGLPADYQDLLKPEYKDMVAMNDPAFSGPTYPLVAGISQILGGEAQGQQFFTQLKANGLKNFKTNDPTLNSVETGAREFGIVQDSAIYGAIKAGQPLGIIYPTSGVIALPSVIGIAAQGKHQGCAQAFVNWMLSADGQNIMTHHDPTDGDTYFIPAINGVTAVVSRETSGFKIITLDVPKWAAAEGELKQWFHDNIVQ